MYVCVYMYVFVYADDPQNNFPSSKFWIHTLKSMDFINNES